EGLFCGQIRDRGSCGLPRPWQAVVTPVDFLEFDPPKNQTGTKKDPWDGKGLGWCPSCSDIEHVIVGVQVADGFPSTMLRTGLFHEFVIIEIMAFGIVAQLLPVTALHFGSGNGKQM